MDGEAFPNSDKPQGKRPKEKSAASSATRITGPLSPTDAPHDTRRMRKTAGAAGSAASFITLPAHTAPSEFPGGSCWRIELHNLGPGVTPIGLEIVGDTVLGRGKTGAQIPDLDLDEYRAFDLGVSRRHALLRPTKNRLYLIDLGSTNGTLLNATPLGQGVARAISDNDIVTLGNLSFTVRVADRPA
jgi:hypothetical protein